MHKSLRVSPGFSLASVKPAATPGLSGGSSAAKRALAEGVTELATLQQELFAESTAGGTRSVLLVVQAMDTAGKGGIIEHVLGAVNPQGVQIFSFKKPTDEEKAHDFLWRVRPHLPTPGHIGLFDRSHYEDVLIHRVHGYSSPEVIEERYGLITQFEAEVAASGTTIVKVMLHISLGEQKSRLAARLADPTKHWKYNSGDLEERAHWPAYMEAYQIALERTSTNVAPWYVIPADHKWYARLAVQSLLINALRGLDLAWPAASFDVAAETAKVAAL